MNTVNSSLWRCVEARLHFWKTSTFCAHCTTQIQTSKQVFKLHLVTRFDERLQEVKNSHFIWLPSWARVQAPGGGWKWRWGKWWKSGMLLARWLLTCHSSSVLTRVPTINTCQQRVQYLTLKSNTNHENEYSFDMYWISMLSDSQESGIYLGVHHGISFG